MTFPSSAVRTILNQPRDRDGVTIERSVRAKLEAFFENDFTGVRLRRSPLVGELGCRAATAGERIYLAEDTDADPALLAHELTHVVQQRMGCVDDRSPGLVWDPELECEAEQMAGAFEQGWPGRASDVGSGIQPHVPARFRDSRGVDQPLRLQPIVTVVYQGDTVAFGKHAKGVGTEQRQKTDLFLTGKTKIEDKKYTPTNLLWELLQGDQSASHLLGQLSKNDAKKAKSKLEHWVKAPKNRALSGKGHNKQFASLEALARALIGRIQSGPSKTTERQLANKVKSSKTLTRAVRWFVQGHLITLHNWLAKNNFDVGSTGRYAYFYSPFISGVKKSSLRNLTEGLKYMQKNRDIIEMSAFLADYAMVARDAFGENVAYIIPQSDARSTHFNVKESSDWVKRARQAQVRLGAGPSATTMQVMRFVKAYLTGRTSDENISYVLTCIALGLFAFWNLAKSRLQQFAEIHTFHEVMLVAYGYGADAIPSLTGPDRTMAEFEYPLESDIPN